MKKQQKIALSIWLILLAQVVFLMRFPEPYPSFALPGFGLKDIDTKKWIEPAGQERETSQDLLMAVTKKGNSIKLIESPVVAELSSYKMKFLSRAILLRAKSNLSQDSRSAFTRFLYPNHFKAQADQKSDFQQQFYAYHQDSIAFLLLLQKNKNVSHVDTIEVF